MGSFSIWHWLIVLLVVLLLFGSGKISGLMGDLATGIKSFKKGLADEDMAPGQPAPPPAQVTQSTAQPAAPAQDQAPR